MSEQFELVQTPTGLGLKWLAQTKMQPLVIDFMAGKQAFRGRQASLKDEAIGRACGLKKLSHPSVLDTTAGLGRDAWVLYQLGAEVTLNERQPEVRALLTDALMRLYAAEPDAESRFKLLPTSDLKQLNEASFDVVYLDPMYPKSDRKQKAAVKKDMQMFQQLVGSDHDADALLPIALRLARHRVVVKRPQHADFLAGQKPNSQVISKRHRFDIYQVSTPNA